MEQKNVDKMIPTTHTIDADCHLLQPVASITLVTAPSTNPTAESIPEIQRVNMSKPRVPAFPLSTAAAGIAINIKPTELF